MPFRFHFFGVLLLCVAAACGCRPTPGDPVPSDPASNDQDSSGVASDAVTSESDAGDAEESHKPDFTEKVEAKPEKLDLVAMFPQWLPARWIDWHLLLARKSPTLSTDNRTLAATAS